MPKIIRGFIIFALMKRKSYLIFSGLFLLLLFILSFFYRLEFGLVTFFLDWAISLINTAGYVGLFFVMTLDSAMLGFFPNEIVVPLAGFSASGFFGVLLVTLVVSLANLFGSLIAYMIGKKLGREFVLDYGRYLMVSKKNLEKAEKFFERHGEKAIFLSRLMPAVRTVISVPAGIVEMDLKKFLYMTLLGSLLCNFLLSFGGFVLGTDWMLISGIVSRFEVFFIGFGILSAIYIIKYF
jgi:membrane protein DedA with SNARE-associated domain